MTALLHAARPGRGRATSRGARGLARGIGGGAGTAVAAAVLILSLIHI